MPGYLRGQLRDNLIFVAVSPNILYYGFSTKDFPGQAGLGLSQGDMDALGHLTPAAVPNTGIRIIAANSPKPPRMKKVVNARPGRNQQGTASSFCATNSVKTAEENGWKFAKPGRAVTITNNDRTVTVGASLTNGGLYLFPMNGGDAEAYADLLGLQLPAQISTTERSRAFTGTSRPKPAKVKLQLPDGSDFSSFCSSANVDNALNNNFQLVKPEIEYE